MRPTATAMCWSHHAYAAVVVAASAIFVACNGNNAGGAIVFGVATAGGAPLLDVLADDRLAVDQDGNGQLDRNEVKRSGLWREIDVSGDGTLDRSEVRSRAHRPHYCHVCGVHRRTRHLTPEHG